ncbi:Protein tssc1 [Phlyctochytrium planicorne]|nr:Protein tssc1 [Phlyctochytrium planicorne]
MMGALVTDDQGRLTNQVGSLSELTSIDEKSNVKRAYWEASGSLGRVATFDANNIRVFTIENSLSAKLDVEVDVSSEISIESERDLLECGAWDPHNPSKIAAAAASSVMGWDIRSKGQAFQIQKAHAGYVKAVDFNPNKQYYLGTGGEDGCVRIWDVRNPRQPLKLISNHAYWVLAVSFNRYHDQLLLTSGADCRVNLEDVVSVSSTPIRHNHMDSEDEELIKELSEKQEDSQLRYTDALVSSYRDYEDSVFGVAWSNADPWIFASLSFDGRVVVNLVPKTKKYSIIL